MRINARLDEERQEKLEQLKQLNDSNTTAVVIKAIDLLYEEQLGATSSTMQDFLASSFVACCEGPADGAENYKGYIREAIDEKYTHR